MGPNSYRYSGPRGNDGRPAWWTGVVYQIYPRSFADSTGNGIGDLEGIRKKLPYLSEVLGVDAIWLSPFYPSPQKDFGYDVADYINVAPEYGTLQAFDSLVKDFHAAVLSNRPWLPQRSEQHRGRSEEIEASQRRESPFPPRLRSQGQCVAFDSRTFIVVKRGLRGHDFEQMGELGNPYGVASDRTPPYLHRGNLLDSSNVRLHSSPNDNRLPRQGGKVGSNSIDASFEDGHGAASWPPHLDSRARCWTRQARLAGQEF